MCVVGRGFKPSGLKVLALNNDEYFRWIGNYM